MRNCIVLLSLAVVAFLWTAKAEKNGAVPVELERLISEVEKRAREAGSGAEQARASLANLYAIRRRLCNAEENARCALTTGREQLREFMKCDAMKALAKSQREEVLQFSKDLDDVIAGKRKIESLSGFGNSVEESVASVAFRGFPVQRGDLILTRNKGIWSRFLIDFSLKEKRFSHADIATAPFEVVSVGVDEKTGRGVVCAKGVDALTHCADEVSVYRYTGPDADKVRERIARAAEKRIGTPFDPAFDLKTKDRLYCTEMVRDCVNEAAGREVIGTSRKGDFEFVAVDDCYRNEMTKVWDCRDVKPVAETPALKRKCACGREHGGGCPPDAAVSWQRFGASTNAPARRTIRFVPKNRGRRQ